MNSIELFGEIHELLVNEENGLLTKIRMVEFNQDQFSKLIEFLKMVPTTADEEDAISLKRKHFDSILYLVPTLLVGIEGTLDRNMVEVYERALSELNKALIHAFING
ncbi:MAG: hypothetical protein AAF655_10395 [Bacteroidota bacterium]